MTTKSTHSVTLPKDTPLPRRLPTFLSGEHLETFVAYDESDGSSGLLDLSDLEADSDLAPGDDPHELAEELAVLREIVEFANKMEEACKQLQALRKGRAVAYACAPYASGFEQPENDPLRELEVSIRDLPSSLSPEARDRLDALRYVLLPNSRLGIWTPEREDCETGELDGPHMIVVPALDCTSFQSLL